MEKVFIHMRKLTLTMVGCLLIICLVPFLINVSAAKQNIVSETMEVEADDFGYVSFGTYNIINLDDHKLYYSFEATNASGIAVNITFSILDSNRTGRNWGTFSSLPDSVFLYKAYNKTALTGFVLIPDEQDYYLIFENGNDFDINIIYSMDKEEIGSTALIGGTIISGVGVLGFLVVIIFRKRHHLQEIPAESNQ